MKSTVEYIQADEVFRAQLKYFGIPDRAEYSPPELAAMLEVSDGVVRRKMMCGPFIKDPLVIRGQRVGTHAKIAKSECIRYMHVIGFTPKRLKNP